MASATATHQPLRIVSRRAQLLLQRHRAGGQLPKSAVKSAPKKDESPWPNSLKYTFYSVCVVMVPLSIGQAIALSPRMRDWMLGDDVGDDDSSPVTSSRGIISLVRSYWGHEDYAPPVDKPQLKHTTPGHRKESQEDNISSLLDLFWLYTPKKESSSNTAAEKNSISMSLENEPPTNIRNDQNILSQYLSAKTNPSGVKARLTLLPCANESMEEGSLNTDDAGYETECTFPANTSMNTLRELCQGSDAQSLKRDLAESDPTFLSKSSTERIRTQSWNEDCRWVVSFVDPEDNDVTVGNAFDGDDAVAQITGVGGASFDSQQENKPSSSQEASKVLRHNTAIHSSWTYFPESANHTPAASPLGPATNAQAGSSDTPTDTSAESLDTLRLQHQIATLEQELKDPSSLRDRDGMYEELQMAKTELRSLKPWWRRLGV
mmetsp:Transcript_1506/g.3196  ORF Transcript_1506/g.3196 Transcript_1506/m.3196 type:complete len:434 (-) Transcript_1506:202-1503(-)